VGRPNRNLGIDVRAPKPITPEQAKWLRANRAAPRAASIRR
jgi:hypothetical protein